MSGVGEDCRCEFDQETQSRSVRLNVGDTALAESYEPLDRARSAELHKISLLLHQPVEEDYTSAESRASKELNQRQYSRCPIPEDRAAGLLSLSGRRYHCRLVELSIGGFGVTVDGLPQLKHGTIGSFCAPGMNYVVSISRQEERSGSLYIGLKQLEEIVDHDNAANKSSPIVGYVIAALSGMLIAMASYYFMNGS